MDDVEPRVSSRSSVFGEPEDVAPRLVGPDLMALGAHEQDTGGHNPSSTRNCSSAAKARVCWGPRGPTLPPSSRRSLPDTSTLCSVRRLVTASTSDVAEAPRPLAHAGRGLPAQPPVRRATTGAIGSMASCWTTMYDACQRSRRCSKVFADLLDRADHRVGKSGDVVRREPETQAPPSRSDPPGRRSPCRQTSAG